MRFFSIFSVLSLLVLTPFSARAAVETYTLDKAHTQIVFFVDHVGFSKSHGDFLDFDGSFDFDENNPESGSVEVSIKTASIDMVGNQKWIDHLKNADFFDVEKYPTMDFRSTGVEMTGENTAKLTGDLTLLGVTKPVTLDVTFNKAGKHPFSGKYVAGFSARGTLKRSDFGMTYGLPLIGDEVELRIEVEGERHNGSDGNP